VLQILAVNDEPSALQLLSGFLEDEAHLVETAANGGEGL
jgi:CheY-like chemotaxis protein